MCSGTQLNYTPQVVTGQDRIPAGTEYTWTVLSNQWYVQNATSGYPATSPITQTLTSTTNNPVNVVYDVTPVVNGCQGSAFQLTVTVTNNPSAGTLSYNGNNPMCITSGGDVSPSWSTVPSGAGSVSYTSLPPTGLTLDNSTGAITPGSSTIGSYTVTYEMGAAGGCGGVTAAATVTIADVPTVFSLGFQLSPLCEGAKLESTNLTSPSVDVNNSALTSSNWEIDDKQWAYGPLGLPLNNVGYNGDNGKHIRYSATNACGTTSSNNNVTLTVLPSMIYPDIRVWMCPEPTRAIILSSYLDTLNFKNVLWSRISNGSPDFIQNTAATTGALYTDNFPKGTHVYKYDIENECGNETARAYILNAKNHVPRSSSDTIVVCVQQPMTAHIQLNQIMGVEAAGTWNYDMRLNQHVIVLSSPSQFAGARIFDAISAWTMLNKTHPFQFTYNSDPDAAAFKFRLDTTQQSCNAKLTKEIVIVVTSKLIP